MHNKKWNTIMGTVMVAICLTLTGCDTLSGIRRTVRLNQLPSPDTVVASLNDVPAIKKISYNRAIPSKSWSLYKGVIQNQPYDQISYSSDNARGVVEVQETESGDKTLTLYCLWMNYQPSQQIVEDTRSLMDQVYSSLRRRAPIIPPETEVQEKLINIQKK
jgi:hypothetical protein